MKKYRVWKVIVLVVLLSSLYLLVEYFRKPDMIIDRISRTDYYCSDTFSPAFTFIRIYVKNIGGSFGLQDGQRMKVGLGFLGVTTEEEVNVPQPREILNVDFDMSALVIPMEMTILVDKENTVDESDENNNSFFGMVDWEENYPTRCGGV